MQQQLPLHRAELLRAVGAPGEGRDTPQIGIHPGLAVGGTVAIHVHLCRTIRGRQGGRVEVENVECRKAGQTGRIHHPEEPSALEVEITHLTVLGLARRCPDGIRPLRYDAPLLGGRQGLDLYRSKLERRVDAEIIGRDGGGDEARGRWLENDGAHVDAADDLVLQSLVVDLDVIVGGVVALGVQIHVDMDSLAEQSRRSEAHLVVQARRLETAATARIGIEQQHRTAALLPGPIGANLETSLAVEAQIRILRGQPKYIPARRGGPFLGGDLFLDGKAVQGPEPESEIPLGPFGSQHHRDRAVVRRGSKSRRPARRAEPGRPESGRLAQREPRLAELDSERRGRGIGLCAEYPGKKQDATQGNLEADHSRSSRR